LLQANWMTIDSKKYDDIKIEIHNLFFVSSILLLAIGR